MRVRQNIPGHRPYGGHGPSGRTTVRQDFLKNSQGNLSCLRESSGRDGTFNVISLCCSSSIHLMLYLLKWMWLVVEIGHLMCFNRWIHCFINLKDDIHCDFFFEWIQWMIWFQMGTLCDLSLSWIYLMVLRFMVEKLEWHPKLNVHWVFKWKPRVWVVGFGLVNSLALVHFYIFYFFLFNLAFLVHV
jgi:hypothetical protein